ncbi:MAG: alkaline phosphatase family protein [Candidatus Altiarchaeota archaeon]|nr:alkaline phosphatase family protein [Candidatus Altiarchaeota archaeon]
MAVGDILKKSFKASIILCIIATWLLGNAFITNTKWVKGEKMLVTSQMLATYTILMVPAIYASEKLKNKLKFQRILESILILISLAIIWKASTTASYSEIRLHQAFMAASAGILYYLTWNADITGKKTAAVAVAALAIAAFSGDIREALTKENNGFDDCKVYDKEPTIRRSIYVIGLDGATWTTLKPALESGMLPNIKKLIEDGVSAEFESIEYEGEYMSPVIWTTIFTGENPEDHGIQGYTITALDESLIGFYSTPYLSTMRKKPAIWNMLSEKGVNSVVSGFWATWPAEEVEGAIISDHLVRWNNGWHHPIGAQQTNRITYPEELVYELEDKTLNPKTLERYRIEGFFNDSWQKDDLEDILMMSYALDQTYIDSGLYAREKYNPELTLIYLEGFDVVQHYFFGHAMPWKFKQDIEFQEKYKDTINLYLKYCDDLVGTILSKNSVEDTIIIISDHGMKAKENPDKRHKNLGWYADHAMEGVVIAYGPDIRKGETINGMTILDFTPTILYYMGMPVSEGMDGKIEYELFTDEFNNENQCSKVKEYRLPEKGDYSGESEDLMRKLQTVGYIE